MLLQMVEAQQTGIWCVCHKGRIWLPQGKLPEGSAQQWQLAGLKAQQIGEWQGQAVWLIKRAMDNDMGSARQLLMEIEAPLFQLVGKAVQLEMFYRSHRYCGYCGHKMYISEHEWCCLCAHCHERYYPQIAPSIIVAIRRDKRILLANHVNHRNQVYTVLAGFVEVGETVEQAVHREVMEEAGILIKNVRYITSQPWPFPHSLMLAFMADYESGEIKIDPTELKDANWYLYDNLPLLPSYGTISRRLIEDTIVLCRDTNESH